VVSAQNSTESVSGDPLEGMDPQMTRSPQMLYAMLREHQPALCIACIVHRRRQRHREPARRRANGIAQDAATTLSVSASTGVWARISRPRSPYRASGLARADTALSPQSWN
jgi:hypothetical protein